jgi:toxin ParE1/3/4
MRIVWHPSAIDELEDILDYIAAHNQSAACATCELIAGNVSALANQPFMGRAGRVAGTRELVISGTSYLVAYEIRDDVVFILTILHGARRWPEAFL